MAALPPEIVAAIQHAVEDALEPLEIPASLVARHAGISPISMQRLLDLFRTYDDKSDLVIAPPESDDAVLAMVRALGRIGKSIASSFGPEARMFMLALLIIQWMRGFPLARIISSRISYMNDRNREYKLPALIRSCMSDVEQYARFEAPKYLACYVDVLRLHLQQEGLEDQMTELPDIAMLLELGVSRDTELSLMTLGLSRSAAISIGEFIAADDLDSAACLSWLRAHDLEALAIPKLRSPSYSRTSMKRQTSARNSGGRRSTLRRDGLADVRDGEADGGGLVDDVAGRFGVERDDHLAVPLRAVYLGDGAVHL
jgi:hypothetical protein